VRSQESESQSSRAMERGFAAIVENGAGMKEIDTDLASLLSAMERKSRPIMSLAKGTTTTIVHCVAQGPAKSPDNAQCVLCLGTLHDHARGQQNAIAEMHGMEAHKIKEAFGNAIMRAAADRNQGVHLDRLIAKANEMNKAHVSDTCRLELERFLEHVFLNALEDPNNSSMYPLGSKFEMVEEAKPAKKVSQHSLPFCPARKPRCSDFFSVRP
jgi:hypothetical protein